MRLTARDKRELAGLSSALRAKLAKNVRRNAGDDAASAWQEWFAAITKAKKSYLDAPHALNAYSKFMDAVEEIDPKLVKEWESATDSITKGFEDLQSIGQDIGDVFAKQK